MHDATVVLIYTYIAGTNVVPVPFYGGCGVYKKKRHPRGWYRRGTGTFETAWVPWTRFKDFACASMIHRGLSYSAQAAAAASRGVLPRPRLLLRGHGLGAAIDNGVSTILPRLSHTLGTLYRCGAAEAP